MHELAITEQILKTALSEATEAGAIRVTRISLKVGQWSTIEPKCVDAYLRILARGTIVEGADLAIESVPVTFECSSCGREYTPEGEGFACPYCNRAAGELISGRELYIESLEVQGADTGEQEGPRGE